MHLNADIRICIKNDETGRSYKIELIKFPTPGYHTKYNYNNFYENIKIIRVSY